MQLIHKIAGIKEEILLTLKESDQIEEPIIHKIIPSSLIWEVINKYNK